MMNRSRLVALVLVSAMAGPLSQTKAADSPAHVRPVERRLEMSQANKALVMKAYQELIGDHDLTALDRYWADEYIQHSPKASDGREALRQMLIDMGLPKMPMFKVDFLRVAAEGDLVWLHLRLPATDHTPEVVLVDIFRVDDGRIVEHWDVMQEVPKQKPNPRSMY
jgi:predicted SnoaL-like aldol condensation-catalyzing enzyme